MKMALLQFTLVSLSVLTMQSIKSQYVETVFGSGTATFGDGIGIRAHFRDPMGLVFDSYGNLYVVDTNNHRIRKITPNSVVSVFAGSGAPSPTSSFLSPYGITIDSLGTIYVADTYNHRVQKISPLGNVVTLAATSAVSMGIAVDNVGNVYVADYANHRIRKITPQGDVTTFAGSGSPGFANGNATSARFSYPYELAIDSFGNLYLADQGNNRIRKITPSGEVTTFAGSGIAGSKDGIGIGASFTRPRGLAFDSVGNLLVADTGNKLIRRVTPYGEVTTIAGSGKDGCDDGYTNDATFRFPTSAAIDSFGNVYISDSGSHRIRKIVLADNIPNIKPPHLSDVDIESLGLVISGGSLAACDEDQMTNSTLLGINFEANVIQLRHNSDLMYESIIGISAAANQTGSLLVRISQDKRVSSVARMISDGYNILQDIACDDMGTVYIAGIYSNNTSFRFSDSSTITPLSYINSTQAGFVAKIASNSSLLWMVTVEGGPLFLEVKAFTDSVIVAIKYAKKPDDQFACIVTPVEGEKLYFNSLNNGVALIRISSSGRVLWSNQVNYAPWDQNQLLSVNRFGDISLSAWCTMPCSWYRNNESNSTFAIPSTHLGAKFVFSANGTLKTGTPLLKFVRIVYGQRLRCRVGLRNATLTIMSHESDVSIPIQDVTVVDIISVKNVVFLSLNGIQRLKLELTRFDEFVVSFSPSMEWSTCGRFNSKLGPKNTRGNISLGTFAMNMDAQIGFLTSFSLRSASPNSLIRFRPTSRFDFRCGMVNETHGLFLTVRDETLELSKLLLDQPNHSYSGESFVLTSVQLQSASLSMFAFILRNDQLIVYVNGERIYQLELMIASEFFLTTFNTDGEFDLMGILVLPQPFESWLTYETGAQDGSSTSTFEQLNTVVVETINTIVTETPKPVVEKEWSLFGLSGLVLYISIGATALGISLFIVVTTYIVVLRKRRRMKNDTHLTNFNFTASTIDETKGQNATLLNSEFKFK